MDGREYFRRDQADGISPPKLDGQSTYAEHVVRACGKRTRYTSVSCDAQAIRDLGEVLYQLQREALERDRHVLVEHEALLRALREAAQGKDRRQQDLAVRALPRVRRRAEGLVDWRFDFSGVERNDLLRWAREHVRPFFARVQP